MSADDKDVVAPVALNVGGRAPRRVASRPRAVYSPPCLSRLCSTLLFALAAAVRTAGPENGYPPVRLRQREQVDDQRMGSSRAA